MPDKHSKENENIASPQKYTFNRICIYVYETNIRHFNRNAT